MGLFETTDNAKTWTPRNKGLRRDWPAEHEEVGFCVHKLVRSPVDGDRMYQQNHVGMHRSDDAGQTWTEITKGLPTEFGFAAATHPHDKETFYVIPLDPGHGRTMPDGQAAVWRTQDAGESWQAMRTGLPQQDAFVGVLREGMAIDYATSRPACTSARAPARCSPAPTPARAGREIASYLPAISSVEVAILD